MISVIVPVFNVSDYLDKCISSILNQTYKDIEVLLIDDGSTDNSGEICDYYSRLDHRIRVFHTTNNGLSAARNYGLDNASGEYISFVDSDDFLSINMFELMMKLFQEKNIEIACCDVEYVTDKDQQQKHDSLDYISVEYMCKEEAITCMTTQSKVRFQVWNKIYDRSVIGDIRFKNNQKYEDIYFERKVFSNVKLVAYINAKLYYYLISRPGNTNSYFHDGKLCVFNEIDDLIKDLKQYQLNGAIKNVVSIRQMFAINLSIEAREKKIDEEKAAIIKRELQKSNKMCTQYQCGNIVLATACSISPSLAREIRILYHKLKRK